MVHAPVKCSLSGHMNLLIPQPSIPSATISFPLKRFGANKGAAR
jgi:hypothetical protein